MKVLIPLLMIPALAACQSPTLFQGLRSDPPVGAAAPGGESYSSSGEPWVLRPLARDGSGGGAEGEAVPTAAAATPGATGLLGRSIASLGAATEPGLWVKTPLVSAPAQGRVRALDTGREIAVELRPAEGASGARLSLQAMQGLGLPLTALSEVEIYGG
ncbi:hypothetical protein [Oceanicola sp. S124]|uniref:hypothetical protein n=1 Tax=Oceanicola sp. S124 TaxID=1042378 RepID=UPI000255971C|nr:hypothetical protein [Oceanicola sp. S124]